MCEEMDELFKYFCRQQQELKKKSMDKEAECFEEYQRKLYEEFKNIEIQMEKEKIVK